MASVTGKDIPLELEFVNVFWQVQKKYFIPESTDEYWKSLTETMNALVKKYPSEYCKSMILGFVGYLDREAAKKFRKEWNYE